MSAGPSDFARIRADGNDDGSFAHTLGKSFRKISRSSQGILNKSAPHFAGISRWGVSKLSSFWHDPFHTLLNLPWGTFIFIFFCTYLLQYIAFAFLYWMQGSCVLTDNAGGNTFRNSLWMSSRVASTLGFTEIRPNPDCGFVNVCVMLQVIFSSLINFIMLGVVFARFSAPFKRASTVRFSKVATVSRHPSGFWALTLRVANLRKHQILQPNIRLMVTAADSITPSFYHHEQLNIEGAYQQLANLELGFPAHITHVITPDSFLYNLSLLEMDTRMMEILVFVDGIDAMTSRYMSARIAYSTSDIYLNEQFASMNLEMRGKKLGLDFSGFDKTVPALDPAMLLDLNEAAGSQGRTDGVGLWQLRHQTFKRLAERYAHLGVSHTAAVAAAAAAGVNGAVTVHQATEVTPRKSEGGNDMHHGLLASSLPSHLPAGASMAMSTSGMPFAVAKASAQEQEQARLAGRLSQLFGSTHKQGPGGAWILQHSESHQNAHSPQHQGGPGPGGEAFVAITTFQRNNQGNAWQQSSIPLSPMPVLGSPPVGLAHHHGAEAGTSGSASASPRYAARSNAPPQFTAPLVENNMYSLEEEISVGPNEPLNAPPPSLPTSRNAAAR